MATATWDAALTSDAAFTFFEKTVANGATMVRPGDYVLVLSDCTSCPARLSRTAAPHPLQARVEYEVFPEASARELQQGLAMSPQVCPQCRNPVGMRALRNLHLARVAPLTTDVLWFNFTWDGGNWSAPDVLLFSPPTRWVSLGASPTNEAVVGAFGRAAHPVVALLAACRGLVDVKGVAVKWASRECAFVAYDATLPVRPEDLFKAVTGTGGAGPFRIRQWKDGQVPGVLPKFGVDKAVQRMLGTRKVDIAVVLSESALERRLAQWNTATKGAVTYHKSSGASVSRGQDLEVLPISDMLANLGTEGLTVDDSLFSLCGGAVPFTKPPWNEVATPPRTRVVPGETWTVNRSGLERQPTNTAPTPPWMFRPRPCVSCARPVRLVRRVFDGPRLNGLYKPPPILIEKHLGYSTALMMSCGEHMRPVTIGDAGAWGMTPEAALAEAEATLPYDELAGWMRVQYSEKHHPIVGFVGPFMGSVITHDLWLEQAIRVTGLNFGNPVHVEVVGENVVTFRPLQQANLGKVGRDLRRQAKEWGLPEPLIPFSVTRKFARIPKAAAKVTIRGTI